VTQHYLKFESGDEVLIDIGGWGILVKLDDAATPRWYDAAYVKIRYGATGAPLPELYPADMVVQKGDAKRTIEQADAVRIWRHRKYPRT